MPLDKQMAAELVIHEFMCTLDELITLARQPESNLHIWLNVPHLIKTHEVLGKFLDTLTEQRVLDLQQRELV